MNLQQLQQEAEKEFDRKFVSLDAWINSKGNVGAKSYLKEFLSSQIQKAVEQAFEETSIEVEKEPMDSGETRVEGAMYAFARGYNLALSKVSSKQKEFLSTNK
jgi:uncharacterized GH25 family protein